LSQKEPLYQQFRRILPKILFDALKFAVGVDKNACKSILEFISQGTSNNSLPLTVEIKLVDLEITKEDGTKLHLFGDTLKRTLKSNNRTTYEIMDIGNVRRESYEQRIQKSIPSKVFLSNPFIFTESYNSIMKFLDKVTVVDLGPLISIVKDDQIRDKKNFYINFIKTFKQFIAVLKLSSVYKSKDITLKGEKIILPIGYKNELNKVPISDQVKSELERIFVSLYLTALTFNRKVPFHLCCNVSNAMVRYMLAIFNNMNCGSLFFTKDKDYKNMNCGSSLFNKEIEYNHREGQVILFMNEPVGKEDVNELNRFFHLNKL